MCNKRTTYIEMKIEIKENSRNKNLISTNQNLIEDRDIQIAA